jgi:hypothetical protein
VPYAVDFCDPAPDANIPSVQPDDFEWIVKATANMAIRRAQAHREGLNNLTWGNSLPLSLTTMISLDNFHIRESGIDT